MDRYFDVLKKHRNRILGQENVIGVGVGHKEIGDIRTKQLSIVVLVAKKLPLKELKHRQVVSRKIEGVDTDIIEVGRVKMLGLRTNQLRPAAPGSSIAHYRVTAGTLGAVVYDRKTGEQLILSNNHILANGSNGYDGRCALGDPILQPATNDGGKEADRIAGLLRYIPINQGSEKQQVSCFYTNGFSALANILMNMIKPGYEMQVLKKRNRVNDVDCALAQPDCPQLISEDIIDFGRVQGVAEATTGIFVKKSGRTTGVTSGTINIINTTLKVEMNNKLVLFSDQIISNLKSEGGDSGSLVLTSDNLAVGLLFAGSDKISVFNRIQYVLEALDVKFHKEA